MTSLTPHVHDQVAGPQVGTALQPCNLLNSAGPEVVPRLRKAILAFNAAILTLLPAGGWYSERPSCSLVNLVRPKEDSSGELQVRDGFVGQQLPPNVHAVCLNL